MNKVLSAVLCVCALQVSYAQLLTIRDYQSDKPLELVTVYSESAAFTGSTNERGQIDISSLEEASDIHVYFIGYKKIETNYLNLESDDFELFMQPADLSLDEVIISATGWNQSRTEVPNRLVRVTQNEVQLQNPQTAADLLSLSGEVFIQKSQLGGGSPMIRGFATNRVLLSVDGVRMNTAIFRSGNLQNVISLDPFTIRNTELIEGPGSVIYGSDAIGGVMSFYTLTPQLSIAGPLDFNASAGLRYSSAGNEKTGHADFNFGWKKLALLSSITYSEYGDLKMGSYGPADYLRKEYVTRSEGRDTIVDNPEPEVQVPSGYHQINLMQKLRYRSTQHLEFNYGFHYSTSSDIARYDRLIRYRGDDLRSAEWYYGPQTWMMNVLSVHYSLETAFYDATKISLSQQFFGESRHNRDYRNPVKTHNTEAVSVWSGNFDFEKRLGRTQFYYGAEILSNRVESDGSLENVETGEEMLGPSRYPQALWRSGAVYVNSHTRLNERWVFQAGMRYNRISMNAEFDTTFYPLPFTEASISNGALTGSVGAIYRPSTSWQVSTNLSSGFRSPNVDDLGKVFDSEPGSVVVPNPHLQPEYAYNLDLTLRKLILENIKVDVTGFYTMLDQALVRRDFSLGGLDSIVYSGELSKVQAIQNAAKATVYGIQARLDIMLPADLGLKARYCFQKGKEELDDGSTAPLRHAAPWYGSVHLTYGQEKLNADMYAIINGEIENNQLAPEEQSKDYLYAVDGKGNPYSPSWCTLNLKISYQLHNNWSLSGGIENMLDKRYRPYSSGITAPGRNLVLSVRAKL